MKKRNKLISLLLATAMLVTPVLTACGDDEDTSNADTTAAESTSDTTVASDRVTLYADREAAFKIVYPNKATKDIENAAESIYMKISAMVDTNFFYGNDVGVVDKGTPEILIGDTNRDTSEDTKSAVTGNSYVVKTVGDDIVVVAAKDWMIPDAVDALIKLIEYSKDRKTATLPADIDLSYTYDAYTRDRWSIKFPAYQGGVLADLAHTNNFTPTTMSSLDSDYKMLLAAETNVEEFEEYIDTLEAEGYTLDAVSESEFIKSYRVAKGEQNMYIYFSVNAGEVRFVTEGDNVVSAEEFSYTYTKQEGETTTLYMYGLTMSDSGRSVGESYTDENGDKQTEMEYSNCGQLFVIKLADNSVMIIDGGSHYQMPKEAAKGLDDFLHEITGKGANEKITISNWLITHAHIDHYAGFARFLMNYHENYTLERLSFNFDYKDANMPTFFNDYLNVWYPDAKYYRPHTGESIQLADIKIDFIYTMEDGIDADTGTNALDKGYANPIVDQNNSSIVAKISFDGKTFLLTGDIYKVAVNALLTNYSDEFLKVDILQVAHHGLNPIYDLYDVVTPDISLYTQKLESVAKITSSGAATLENVKKNTTGDDLENIYFQGNCTAGVSVDANGSMVVTTRDVIGNKWDGQDLFYIYQ